MIDLVNWQVDDTNDIAEAKTSRILDKNGLAW